MSTVSIRHIAPAFRTYAGEQSLTGLDKELTRVNSKRVVVMCGSTMANNDQIRGLVEAAIGSRLAGVFADTREHSPVDSVEAAAGYLRQVNADAVVALGGGSAVVTARAATMLSAEDGTIGELATRRENGKLISPRLSAPKIPQFIVPSTPTTAYAKAGAAVRDLESGERYALFDPKARATAVFMHPVIAATAPSRLAIGSALNAFGMAVDGLQSEVADPLAEANMRQALRMLSEWLPKVGDPLDGEIAVQLMLAALLAGQASDHMGTGLAQPISHALGPLTVVGNGVVEALMLPHTMTFNIGYTDKGLRAVAQALGVSGDAEPQAAINEVRELLVKIGIPARLRDVGSGKESFDSVADHVLDDWSSTTVPRPANKEEILGLLESAW